ncbi:MAG: hypothetical protein QOE65_1955 [Solirubrobacteraceae bacterium]|jgi:hypothetical protein|nr:hypothetical protein [Solirubrobacteraceae bacterium]
MSTNDSPVFDVAMGGDVSALNATVAAFYGTCRGVFTQTFQVNQEGITTVEVDFQAPPTVTLAPTAEVVDHARALVTGTVSDSQVEATVENLTAGAITASCTEFACTINGGPHPIVVTGSVVCSAAVDVQPGSGQGGYVFVLQLSNGTFTDPAEPDLSALVNAFVIPKLLAYLNNSILANIQIPVISLEGVTFAMPVVTDESAGGDDFLLGYTGLNPVVAPAQGTPWPGGTLFAGVDAAALDAVAAKVLPAPSGSGGCDDPINLSWDYWINFSPNFEVNPGAGPVITATMGVTGGASITWHTPDGLPNISFGGSITGSATAMAAIVAVQDGANEDIKLIIQGLGDLQLNLSIDGLPGFLDEFLSFITNAILDPIAAIAGSVMSGFPISVYTLSPISLQFADLGSYQLVVENLELSQVAGPGGLGLMTVTATAGFQPAPSVSVRKSSVSTPRLSELTAAAVA